MMEIYNDAPAAKAADHIQMADHMANDILKMDAGAQNEMLSHMVETVKSAREELIRVKEDELNYLRETLKALS